MLKDNLKKVQTNIKSACERAKKTGRSYVSGSK